MTRAVNGIRGTKFGSIVSFARGKVVRGDWRAGDKLPSEHDLCARFGVSRMTARRALDQLASDGLIVRRRGSGSYLTDYAVRSSFLVIRNIAEEITESGRAYSSRVVRHCIVASNASVSQALAIRRGLKVFHSLIVHRADAQPVQLEYRFVRRDAAPGYIKADLSEETPNQYLQRHLPLTEARQEITAVCPSQRQCAELEIAANEACLLIKRITAARVGLVSYAEILAPASRYRLAGHMVFSSPMRT